MRTRSVLMSLISLAGFAFAGASLAAVEILKEEPPKGSVSHGKVIYVDDGTCPVGEVKEITAGDQRRATPRQVRCVKRPQ